MKLISLIFLCIIYTLTANAQIEKLEVFKHTLSFLHSNFKIDQFNKGCKKCYDCRVEFYKDSLNRADTSHTSAYIGSRTAAACVALQKLQSLLALDSLLQSKVTAMEKKYKSDNDSLYREFVHLNKSWYTRLDQTVQYYNSFNESTYSGPMMEQINIATIMVKSRLEELTAIEKLLTNE